LRDFTRRTAEEGPSAVWLVIRGVDPLVDASEQIEQIVDMELGWSRRLHLAAETVAFGVGDAGLQRAALEVEGPGAFAYLEMEQGVHRFHGNERGARRVRVDVVPRRRVTAQSLAVRVKGPRPKSLGVEATLTLRLEHEPSGQVMDWYGTDARTLEGLAADLAAANVLGTDSAELAREYGRDGTGARDPRTGETIVRAKDALSGKLDRLLEAWQLLLAQRH
jgi:hypothetical protein